MNYIKFKIKSNLDNAEIDRFISFYKERKKNPAPIWLEFIDNESEKVGEVDALFLCYLMLFLAEDKREVVFVFSESINEDRIYSLRLQIAHLIYTLNIFSNKTPQIKLLKYKVNEDTGELLVDHSKNYLNSLLLRQSVKFIPLIFINQDYNEYFGPFYSTNKLDKLYKVYFNGVTKDILKKTKLSENEIISNFELKNLSFIELCIFRLLLSDNSFKLLGKKGGGSINYDLKKSNIQINIDIIKYFKRYAQILSGGIKELAINIIEHSDNKKGVISARIFEKSRINLLKNVDENFLNFYSDKDLFVDINIVDLGSESIRDKYVKNINDNKRILKNYNQFKINFDKDIEILNDKSKYFFSDFFIPNPKTDHQLNKLISRYGIQHFTHIIVQRYQGYVKVISHSENVTLFNNEEKTIYFSDPDNFRFGTSYGCLIPLTRFQEYYYKVDKSILDYNKVGIGENSVNAISKFRIINLDELSDNTNHYDIIRFNYSYDNVDSKYDEILSIYNGFLNINKMFWNNIYLINAHDYNIINSSSWLRLLSALSIDFKNIIIYNISKEITQDIITIRSSQSKVKEFNFWDSDSYILFYSFQTSLENGFRRFGANLLSGKSESIYNYMNLLIWRHHYSFFKGFIPQNLNNNVENANIDSPLFTENSLNYFELIITNEDNVGGKISLFEESLQYALNKNLETHLFSDTNNKGYKITKTHFRLGSKIHIEDFYYAKRVFHNSFFTTPMAYLLSNYIAEYIGTKSSSLKEITLIGYENYSDYLVSTTRNLLSKKFENLKISHATYINGKELNRPLNSIYSDIFIIVPIASSFSTSLKIKNDLISIFERNIETKDVKFNFHEPHLNFILVGNEGFDNIEKLDESEDDFISFRNETLKTYGWISINKKSKLIKINSYQNKNSHSLDEIVLQKYFIPVYTNWHKSNNCNLCFPIQILDEKCLVETGTASITPQLIFGFPKTKPNKRDNKILNLNGSLLYGNLKKEKNRYLYYARIGDIINKKEIKNEKTYFINKEKIKEWLEEIREKYFKSSEYESKKIVLVTPSTGTKSNFVDLVNEIVFKYTANCLTISLYEEYIENAESLYGDGIYKSDIIVFVDDVLSTIHSFIETNYIIKYIKNKLGSGRGIDYCISLINRMSYDSEENLVLKLLPLVNNDCYDIIDTIKKTNDIQKEIQEEFETDTKEFIVQISNNRDKLDSISSKLFKNEIKFEDAENRLLYYCKINNPTIEEPNKLFPLEKEAMRYKSLSDTSSLDSIRYLFSLKRNKLQVINLSEIIESSKLKKNINSKFFQERKLFQLLVLDEFYSLFEYNNKNQTYKNSYDLDLLFPKKRTTNINKLDSFYKLKSKIDSKLYDNSRSIYKTHKNIIEKYKHNLDFVILKIICSTPLIYYKRIREVAFEWVLTMLEEYRTGKNFEGKRIEEIIGIDNLNENNIIDYFKVNDESYYSELQKLKFLLKRAVQLKSNYIIHLTFLSSLKNLINILYLSREDILKKKAISDNTFINMISQIFNGSSSKLKFETWEYINNLKGSNLFNDNFFNSFTDNEIKFGENIDEISSQQLKIFPEETDIDDKRKEIEQKLKDLKVFSKYRLTTSKKLIYDIISLIQELILEHETKAVKLEENINKIAVKHYNETTNGDFNHFLRLLKLENTAAINFFGDYFFNKEQQILKEEIKIDEIKAKFSKYKNEPKFTSIKDLIFNDNNYSYYLTLRANLQKWQNHLEDPVENLTSKIRIILDLSSRIIGEDVEAYFTINYKNIKEPLTKDIYVSEKYFKKEDKNKFYLDDNLENSITYKMFNGITEKGYPELPLSNFEVYRSEIDSTPLYRQDILFGNEETFNPLNSTECRFSGITDKYNLLFILISDFNKGYIRNNEKIIDKPILYSQGVLTFYIKNSGLRVNEKRLRLLLLLRNPISDFLKFQINESQLMELWDNKELKKYQKHMQHGIGNFISYQEQIIQDYEKIKHKIHIPEVDGLELKLNLEEEYIRHGSFNFNEFRVINKSIASQIGVTTKRFKDENILSYDYFIGIIDTIYKSKRIQFKEVTTLNYKNEIVFENSNKFENITLPTVIINSMFPEIIINQKKYGKSRSINWVKTSDNIVFIFKNEINVHGLMDNVDGFGTKMCREIGELYNNINITINIDQNIYQVIIDIKTTK